MDESPQGIVNRLTCYVDELLAARQTRSVLAVRGRTQLILRALEKLHAAHLKSALPDDLVARIKREKARAEQEIATRLLQDGEARNLIEAAREQEEEKQTPEWLASNMVSWFSQRITVGESEWVQAFERTKIDGLWAYKPSTSGSTFGRTDACSGIWHTAE